MMGETGGDQLLALFYLNRYDLKSALAFQKCRLHTLIYTFHLEAKLQYLGSNQEAAGLRLRFSFGSKWWFFGLTKTTPVMLF